MQLEVGRIVNKWKIEKKLGEGKLFSLVVYIYLLSSYYSLEKGYNLFEPLCTIISFCLCYSLPQLLLHLSFSGAFGAVFKCSCDGKMYALKTEGQEEKVQLLKMEVFVLLELSKAKLDRHFCKIEDRGQCDKFNYVVMTLVGKSLQDLRLMQPKRRFSMGTALSIGIQCLEALEDLHSVG